MVDEQRKVHEFHLRVGAPVHDRPTWPGDDVHRMRVGMIEEELAEFRNAGEAHSLALVADALGDLLYVVYGAAVEYGIDLEPVFQAIHTSNLSKCDPQAIRRPDGKVLKGANYAAPKIKELVEKQLATGAFGGS